MLLSLQSGNNKSATIEITYGYIMIILMGQERIVHVIASIKIQQVFFYFVNWSICISCIRVLMMRHNIGACVAEVECSVLFGFWCQVLLQLLIICVEWVVSSYVAEFIIIFVGWELGLGNVLQLLQPLVVNFSNPCWWHIHGAEVWLVSFACCWPWREPLLFRISIT